MGEIEAISLSRKREKPVRLRGSVYLWLCIVFIWVICKPLQILRPFRLTGGGTAAQ